MNMQFRPGDQKGAEAVVKQAIADCDIHPTRKDPKGLYPYLEKRWRDYLDQYGALVYQGMVVGPLYPKGQPNASRRDAVPPEGGVQGSSLRFMQQQHLDPNNVSLGIMCPLSLQNFRNLELGAALARATNDWQVAEWSTQDKRLRASVVIANEDAEGSVAEIRKRAGDSNFAQVLVMSRNLEPLGQRRYWPIYRAAEEAGFPIGIHAFGNSGHAITPGGWPSYYIEEMVGHSQCQQSALASMVLEGVFERFPKLKVISIEAGFGWVPSLAWRLDKHFDRLRSELSHLKKKPSEYLREHVWWSTQPMEEPDDKQHMLDVIGWLGWDRLMFATDYPHWDYDDPSRVLPAAVSKEDREAFFLGNARKVFGIAA